MIEIKQKGNWLNKITFENDKPVKVTCRGIDYY
jgi:hypothetical protein